MFGWFKRKAKTNVEPAVERVPATAFVVPAAVKVANDIPASAPLVEQEHALAVPETIAYTASPSAELVSSWKQRFSSVKAPLPGEQVLEVQLKRRRSAEIVRIQAGGRRVLARLENSGRTYAYTRRQDGTFRLEQAPTTTAARLVPAQPVAAR